MRCGYCGLSHDTAEERAACGQWFFLAKHELEMISQLGSQQPE
jgi:hypothetical protein